MTYDLTCHKCGYDTFDNRKWYGKDRDDISPRVHARCMRCNAIAHFVIYMLDDGKLVLSDKFRDYREPHTIESNPPS